MSLGRTHLSGLKKYKGVNEGQPTIVLKAAKLPRVATCASSNTTKRPKSQSKRTRLMPKTKGGPKARGYKCLVAKPSQSR
jgi:hypothetical protein